MEMFFPCDLVIRPDELNPRLPIPEIQELNEQMSCNLFACDDESELYLNTIELPNHISIVSEMEMFMRDAESDVFN